MRYYSQVVLADYPQAYYQLDEASGTTATDSSGNAFNGTYAGSGVTYSIAGAIANDSDTAIQFSGNSGANVALPAGLSTAGYTALTVECWFKPSTFSGNPNVVANTTFGSNQGFVLGANSGGGGYLGVGNGSVWPTATFSSPAWTAGTWYYLVGTWDGTTIRIYLNGALQGSASLSGAIASSGNPISIGFNSGFSSAFGTFALDEIALYNVALNQSQISSHYTAGLAQLLSNFYYGPFQLNEHPGGLGYFLQSRDLDFPEYQPQMSPLALYDGYKITGYQVGQRQIQCDIFVIGTSRTDCIARKDTLELALAKRDQQLILHEDGRFWVANAISGKTKFAAGQGVVIARIPVLFICANPYATAANAATPFASGTLAYTTQVIAGTYQSSTFSMAGGGTMYSWPTLTLTHKLATPTGTRLNAALAAGTAYTSITVVSAPALSAGQVLVLSNVSTGSTPVQKVTVSATVTAGATSIPVNSFIAFYSFPASSFNPSITGVNISTAWNNVTIAQLTDNYQLEASGNNDQTYTISTITSNNTVAAGTFLLPQAQNDSLTIYCDPTSNPGWSIIGTVQGVTFYYQPQGAFPPMEPGTTQWQVTITSDRQPSADFKIAWTPRYTS